MPTVCLFSGRDSRGKAGDAFAYTCLTQRRNEGVDERGSTSQKQASRDTHGKTQMLQIGLANTSGMIGEQTPDQPISQ